MIYFVFLGCRGSSMPLRRHRDFGLHKYPFAAIDCEQVRHQLACHGERSPIAVSFLSFPFVEQRQIGIQPGRQMCCLHQYGLQMRVALLEIGVRFAVPAEPASAPHNPQ
jgi:hypothetical protein